MEKSELDFARIVREHKGTIYTVCYMFSKDEEEVADLFQDILVNLWKGFAKFRGDSSVWGSACAWRARRHTGSWQHGTQ